MKKILVFGMSGNPGGVESFVLQYYLKMREKYIFDFVVFTPECAHKELLEMMGSKIYFINIPEFRHPIKYIRKMKTFFKEHHDEYESIWCNWCDLCNSNFLRYAKYANAKRIIIHSHNNQLMDKGRKTFFYKFMHKMLRKHILKYGTDFWACSTEAGEFFFNEPIMQSAKFRVITNAIDTQKFSFSQEKRNFLREKYKLTDKFVVGHVARFNKQKNQLFLIDIFNEIYKKRNDAILMLVGHGEEEEAIRRKVSEYNLSNSVLFLGARNDVHELYNAMDIFLFPSNFEGLGIVLIEAQANGLYSFTSDYVVPKTAKVSNLLSYIDLALTPNKWANVILETCNIAVERENSWKTVKDAGYDIENEAAKLLVYMED